MRTITVCQRKGGNGKSTSALNLAHAFALQGKKVLLIDLDEQKNTTSAIATKGLIGDTAEALLLNEEATVADVAEQTVWEGVDLIAASGNLSGVIRELDEEIGSHRVLLEKLREARGYDLCLIDTSPSLNILVINALCASTRVFIPLSSTYFSLQGLGQTLEAIGKIQQRLNPCLKVLGMAFVIHDKRSRLAREVVAKAREAYGERVCDTLVGLNIKIEEAQVKRQSILGYAPGDRGAAQYRALAAELAVRLGV
jgi:chromosome partitioning protein